jgi:hypothetical protein
LRHRQVNDGFFVNSPGRGCAPSWARVAERLFASRVGATTIEVASSHVAMVSHPDEVVSLIGTAVAAWSDASR